MSDDEWASECEGGRGGGMEEGRREGRRKGRRKGGSADTKQQK